MAFGLQFEISASLFGIASGCIGLELIWYTSNRVTDAKKGISFPYLYWYCGGGLSLSSGNVADKLIGIFKQWLKEIAKKPSKIFSALKLSFSFSVCAFLVYGYTIGRNGPYKFNNYKPFVSYRDYEGTATCRSYTAFHVKGYHGYSKTCDTWGIGYDTNKFGASYTTIRCKLLTARGIEIPTAVSSKIKNKSMQAK